MYFATDAPTFIHLRVVVYIFEISKMYSFYRILAYSLQLYQLYGGCLHFFSLGGIADCVQLVLAIVDVVIGSTLLVVLPTVKYVAFCVFSFGINS